MAKTETATNLINWFEIPASDLARAKKFYEKALGLKIQPMEMPGMQMQMFPMEGERTGGALVQSENHIPGQDGALVYLNGGPQLEKTVKKVEKAGGQIVLPVTDIGQFGRIAQFIDSEGNRVALHSA